MDESPTPSSKYNLHAIGSLTFYQKNIAKGHLIDSSNKAYGIFLSFSLLNPEFFPGSHISDNFPDCFYFNLVNQKGKEKDKIRAQELDDMVLRISPSHQTTLVVTDASIKNNIAISILHVHIVNQPLTKTVHHAAFVTSIEAELFTIRCGINQACSKDNVSKIVIVIDSIHATKIIFDSKPYLYQSHTAVILSKLQGFFNTNCDNSIDFWKCPSHLKWRFHHNVDKDSKLFHPTPTYPCKISWDYCKKMDSDDIINQWKMMFQASDGKGKQFLDLLDDDLNTIEPSYTKDGLWLKVFGHSNSLCAHATRAITNHGPTGKYWLWFFPNEDFVCPCNKYPIESRRYILHECRRFNGYWNLRRDSLNHFVMFLIANPNAFAFTDK